MSSQLSVVRSQRAAPYLQILMFTRKLLMFTRKLLKALTEGQLLLGMIGTLLTRWLLLLVARCFWLSITAFTGERSYLVTCWCTRILCWRC